MSGRLSEAIMRCLLCHKEIGSDSLRDLLFEDDVLCSACRQTFRRAQVQYEFEGVKAEALWFYGEGFASSLLQYKERWDEALAPVFLYPDRNRIRRKYRGYVFLLVPSSRRKREERGFNHLEKMLACTGLETMEPFELIEERCQKGADPGERRRMEKNIRLKKGVQLPGRICVFDDTLTTGSTMRGALNCMKRKEGVRILTAGIAAENVNK